VRLHQGQVRLGNSAWLGPLGVLYVPERTGQLFDRVSSRAVISDITTLAISLPIIGVNPR
jgi:hypothetical protein